MDKQNQTQNQTIPAETSLPELLPDEFQETEQTETYAEIPTETQTETETQIETQTQMETQTETRAAEPAPVQPVPGFSWMGVLLCAALVVVSAAVTLGVSALIRRRTQKRQQPQYMEVKPTGGVGAVQVGKLHGQGARDYQQDCFAVSPEEELESRGVLTVVADGMGGLEHGELVSQTAVTTILNGFLQMPAVENPQLLLWELLRQGNEAVNQLLGSSGLKKSGSTLLLSLLQRDQFYFLSVGDSRICLWRDGQLSILNREHDFSQELLLRVVNGQMGFQEALQHPRREGLTSYLGMGAIKYADAPVEPVAVRPGDVIILMSDGIYNTVSQQELAQCIHGSAGEMAQTLGALVEEKANPHQDNYTAVFLQLEAAEEGGETTCVPHTILTSAEEEKTKTQSD